MAADPTPNLTKSKAAWSKFQTVWATTLPGRAYQLFTQTNLIVEVRKK